MLLLVVQCRARCSATSSGSSVRLAQQASQHAARRGRDRRALRRATAAKAARARVADAVADGVVVGIEEHPEPRVERPVAGDVALENEGLEKPRRVREMPLHRARVGHRLQRAVLGGQRSRQLEGRCACRGEALRQRSGIGAGRGMTRACAWCRHGILPGLHAARAAPRVRSCDTSARRGFRCASVRGGRLKTRPQAIFTRGPPATTRPITAARSKPSERKRASTSSAASCAQATSNPPEV